MDKKISKKIQIPFVKFEIFIFSSHPLVMGRYPWFHNRSIKMARADLDKQDNSYELIVLDYLNFAKTA